jgi:hypothetical protein
MAGDELMRAVAADSGVTLQTVEPALPFVHGYVVDAPMTGRAALAPPLAASGLDLHDSPDGLHIAAPHGREPAIVPDVVAEDRPMIARRRPDPGEAIGQVALSYVDRERSYQLGSVTAIAAGSGPLESVSAGLVLDLAGARSTAERVLNDRLGIDDAIEFTAPPSLLALEVGDAVAVDGGSFIIIEIRDGLARRIDARAVAPALEVTSQATRVPVGDGAAVPRAVPVLDFAPLPPLPEDVSRSRLAVGAFASPWPGTIAVADDLSGTSLATLPAPATLGELTAPLAAGSIFIWDEANAVELVLYGGHLSSRDDDEVLAGANRIAVLSDAGDWEIIGFAQAELTAPQAYRLTRLLRGQGGTDRAIGATSAGNRVLLLDSATRTLDVPNAWLGATAELRSYGGAADPTGTLSDVPIGLGPILPLAPVHLRAVRVAGGDITLSWVRRSRADTDSWVVDDAPLDVSPEAYRVTILDAGMPVRTIDSTVPSASYTAAQQAADFGAPPASFGFSVAQLSPLYGPGHAATGAFDA